MESYLVLDMVSAYTVEPDARYKEVDTTAGALCRLRKSKYQTALKIAVDDSAPDAAACRKGRSIAAHAHLPKARHKSRTMLSVSAVGYNTCESCHSINVREA
jgi:hypothetical protein